MRKYLICMLLILPLCLQAQERKPKGFFPKVIHFINDIDTLSISPNRYNLTFMLESSNWYENYTFSTVREEVPQKLRISPDVNYKLGAYFGWKWIFIGWSIDMNNLFNKKHVSDQRTEYSLSLYSSVVGCDLYYRKSGSSFKLRNAEDFRPDNTTGALEKDISGLSVDIAGLNAYWVLNHRHFSYPAAYSQSTNQRRNAGSIIVGFSFSRHKIGLDYHGLPDYVQDKLSDGLKFNKLTYSDFSLSAGYTYNWVFAKNCLFNVSVAPAVAYKRSKIDSERTTDNPILRKINFDLVSRAGITYNNSKYYIGLSMVMNTFGYRSDKFSINNSFGTLRFYLGFNFWKKREYRNED